MGFLDMLASSSRPWVIPPVRLVRIHSHAEHPRGKEQRESQLVGSIHPGEARDSRWLRMDGSRSLLLVFQAVEGER